MVPLLQLAEHAVFDDTDEAGVILDTQRGLFLTLNAVATLILQAGLRYNSLDEALSHLRQRIDASDNTLISGFHALKNQLDERTLLVPEEQKVIP